MRRGDHAVAGVIVSMDIDAHPVFLPRDNGSFSFAETPKSRHHYHALPLGS